MRYLHVFDNNNNNKKDSIPMMVFTVTIYLSIYEPYPEYVKINNNSYPDPEPNPNPTDSKPNIL